MVLSIKLLKNRQYTYLLSHKWNLQHFSLLILNVNTETPGRCGQCARSSVLCHCRYYCNNIKMSSPQFLTDLLTAALWEIRP